MTLRKSAADLEPVEIDQFLNAVFTLKAIQGSNGFSLYDELVSFHGAVMGVITPTSGSNTINFGHGNIGFLPWHRQYLRVFERTMSDALGEDVSIPYWDWDDDIEATNRLFTKEFLSSLRWGGPQDIVDGLLRSQVPTSDRPGWWPPGINGFRVDRHLEENWGGSLERGSTERLWPPNRQAINALIEFDYSMSGRHPLWAFWLVLEQGEFGLHQTHNAGHRYIGGHMVGSFSPNDPVFWMHHANVDRIWAEWQQHRIDSGLSANHLETYPDASEESPITNQTAPEGHKIGDTMWPWNGNTIGYQTGSVSRAVRNRLPVINETVHVEDVLDSSAINVAYQPTINRLNSS